MAMFVPLMYHSVSHPNYHFIMLALFAACLCVEEFAKNVPHVALIGVAQNQLHAG